jgi:hypothetical protein
MYPEYPMAPVVRAIIETNPEFNSASTDLFACGSTLGNLLRFARGVDKAFRFNIEVVGETVFFVRKENDPKEVIKDVRGYGHTFPEAYTTWEQSVKGSETHQRIIRYEFGGLECLVRFESDGYIETPGAVNDATHSESAKDPDDLLAALQDTSISRPSDFMISTHDALTVKQGGTTVLQDVIFDLKTRSGKYKKDIDMSDIHPALWIKQISNFVVAYHNGAGLFEDIRVQNVKNDVQAWAKDNELLNSLGVTQASCSRCIALERTAWRSGFSMARVCTPCLRTWQTAGRRLVWILSLRKMMNPTSSDIAMEVSV